LDAEKRKQGTANKKRVLRGLRSRAWLGSGVEDGLFDFSGGPGLGGFYEGMEDGATECGLVVGAFRMPLDGEDEVACGVEFDGFDDVVLGAASGDDEVVAGAADGLVVAAVDEEAGGVFAELAGGAVGGVGGAEEVEVFFRECAGDESGETGMCGDCDEVSLKDAGAGGVVDRRSFGGGLDVGWTLSWDVLNKCAAAPHVEGLRSLAYGEDGFVEVEGVLEEQFVDGGAQGVGGFAEGIGGFAVFLGIDVGGRAGEQDAMAGGEDFGDALRGFVKRDGDGRSTGGVQGVEVLREGSKVVGCGVLDVLRAGGLRYGDMDHGFPLCGL
jgi:hypothetical protein